MSSLMISVAGIRGVVGDSLRAEDIVRFVAAFAAELRVRRVVLGGDTRPSRETVRQLVVGACMASGCEVLDLGVCPTPTIGFMTKHLGAGGGIGITASHNPLQWNALKFFSDAGTFLVGDGFERVMRRYRENDFQYVGYESLGCLKILGDACGPHRERVLAAVDRAIIRRAGFKAVVDLCNGAGAALIPDLLEELGCAMVPLHADPEKAFERPAEPLPENLGALCEAVWVNRADIGFALDPDADRLALVDETGRAIGEERTLALAARAVLQATGSKAPLVANLSTTRALDDVAAEFGTRVERTKIGEANVVAGMLAAGAIIGGEGNGGVIYPAVHPGRDAATGIALILNAMAGQGRSLSQLNAEVPDYAMVKGKVGVEGKKLGEILKALRARFAKEATDISDLDGLKISLADSWVHVRPSGTEPIVRVFAEAPTVELARDLVARAMEVVEH